jgi:hypothetical protein
MRRTTLRRGAIHGWGVTATYGGAAHELTRDRDDANGWTFADMVVTVTGSGASVMKQDGNRFSARCTTEGTSAFRLGLRTICRHALIGKRCGHDEG